MEKKKSSELGGIKLKEPIQIENTKQMRNENT